jgi:hypothetical protein
MFVNPFGGPKARISSARRHIANLLSAESTFFSNDAFAWASEQAPNGNWHTKIKLVRNMPEDISHCAWDTAQNLRAALDLAVCATATIAGATNLKHTYFHFASSKEEWEKSVKGRTKAAPPYAVEVMRTFEPWGGGNEALYSLNLLAVTDKHQMVTPVCLQNNSILMNNFSYSGRGPVKIGVTNWDIEKREIVVIETGEAVPIPLEGYRFTSFLAYSGEGHIYGKPIVALLNQLTNMCQQIIEALEIASNQHRGNGI